MMIGEGQALALGYTGGGLLALCLIPQIAKIVKTRSTGDIALSWALIYIAGLILTLAYLIIQGAIAAWIPLIFEMAGSITIICLKLLFEHTRLGRRAGSTSDDLEVVVQEGDVTAGDANGTTAATGVPPSLTKLSSGSGGPCCHCQCHRQQEQQQQQQQL